MDAKTILIVIGLVVVLYLQGCFPTAAASTQQQSAPAMAPADCYAQVNAAVRDLWPEMNKVQRGAGGLRAIWLCEGGN